MGRPIKKTRMLATLNPAVGSGTIQVTAYFPVGGSSTTDIGSYIVSQRGSRQFKIHQGSDSTEAVYTLKAVAPASLAAGEFCVQVILNDSTVAYVDKFYNRTVNYVTAAGDTGNCTYALGTEATDEGGGASAAAGSIDVI
jgi:hypothetical protein